MPTSIRLDAATERRLNALAAKTGRSQAYYIRAAIDQHLDDLEDIYLADYRLADLRAGRAAAISMDEMSQRLGLDD